MKKNNSQKGLLKESINELFLNEEWAEDPGAVMIRDEEEKRRAREQWERARQNEIEAQRRSGERAKQERLRAAQAQEQIAVEAIRDAINELEETKEQITKNEQGLSPERVARRLASVDTQIENKVSELPGLKALYDQKENLIKQLTNMSEEEQDSHSGIQLERQVSNIQQRIDSEIKEMLPVSKMFSGGATITPGGQITSHPSTSTTRRVLGPRYGNPTNPASTSTRNSIKENVDPERWQRLANVIKD